MRRFKAAYTLLTLMFACSLGLSAQTAADSVKIRLRTSPSAEIGLDGDVSSTNFLTTRTSVGKHKVTVTYGTDFVRTFDIEVTREETFEFNIEGKVTVNSLPDKRKVYLGSVEQGMTPLTLNVLGTHNLRVEGDALTYFDATERISISPYQELELSYTLGKRPPRLYGFLTANYILETNAVSFMGGVGRRWGGYLKVALGINGIADNNDEHIYKYPVGKDEFEKMPEYSAMNIGLTWRPFDWVTGYLGSGYGRYSHGLIGSSSTPYSVEGIEIDAGVLLKWKALLMQIGYTRILEESYSGNHYGAFNIGLGFTIHRNKKR